VDERRGEPWVVFAGDRVGQGSAPLDVAQAKSARLLAVEEARHDDCRFLWVIGAGHAVLAERCREEREADDAFLLEQRPFLELAVIRSEFMELRPFPRIEGVIVALSALDLDAEEYTRGFGGALGGGVGAAAGEQEKRRTVLSVRTRYVLHLAGGRQH